MKNEKNIFRDSAHLTTGQMLDYIKARLTREEVRKIEHHLNGCELCNDALDGLKKSNADASMLNIASELQKMMRKRKRVRRKLFSRLDFISLFAVFFLILFLIAVAVVLFWNK